MVFLERGFCPLRRIGPKYSLLIVKGNKKGQTSTNLAGWEELTDRMGRPGKATNPALNLASGLGQVIHFTDWDSLHIDTITIIDMTLAFPTKQKQNKAKTRETSCSLRITPGLIEEFPKQGACKCNIFHHELYIKTKQNGPI